MLCQQVAAFPVGRPSVYFDRNSMMLRLSTCKAPWESLSFPGHPLREERLTRAVNRQPGYRPGDSESTSLIMFVFV